MPGFELISDEEFLQVKEVFDKGGILFRHGFDNLRNGIYKVKEFEKAFAAKMNVPNALAVTSGTAALRVALASLGIGKGDEVITQSFTFVATVEAIIEAAAIPIVTEIDKTLNMDPKSLEDKISEKTKAIIVVHMLGVPAQMDKILKIAKKHNLPLIEDTAWGCGGRYNEIPLGTLGEIGTFSFDFAKTMTTGEGGMLVFKHKEHFEKAAAWHDHGHENNPSLPRWEDSRSSSGFNYRMMELQGAVGLAQLSKLDDVVTSQRKNYYAIKEEIKDLDVEFRHVPEGSFITADALVFFTKDNKTARECRKKLLEEGVGTKILPEAITWHFAATWDHMQSLVNAEEVPLKDRFPNSVDILDRAVSLPIFVNMIEDIPSKVRTAIKKVI